MSTEDCSQLIESIRQVYHSGQEAAALEELNLALERAFQDLRESRRLSYLSGKEEDPAWKSQLFELKALQEELIAHRRS